jgi:hypothetical protein
MPSIPIFTRSTDGVLLDEKGGSFLYRLKVPIRIPYGAEPTMALTGASIWYVNPNILTGINDTLHLYFAGLVPTGDEVQTLVFDKGLYSLKALNSVIKEKLQGAAGGDTLTGNEFELVPDTSTQKIKIVLRPTAATGTCTVIFDGQRSISTFLGFNQGGNFSADVNSVVKTISAPVIAVFNSLSYFIVHVDGLSSGVMDSRGGDSGSELAIITPSNVSTGKQIVVHPYNILEVPCKAAGMCISQFTVRLTDQSGRAIDMLGEEFSVQMRIRW